MAYNRKLLYTKSFPSWNTPEGNLGGIQHDGAMTPIQLVANEIDEPGSTITYAVTTGALPTGLTLSSSGEISGTPTGYTAPEYVNFTITATDDEGETVSRDFFLKIQGFPFYVNYLVVAGGGGGNRDNAGGGGAGGYLESSAEIQQNQTYAITVGAGGNAGTGPSDPGLNGGDSSIIGPAITTTSLGGGRGGSRNGVPPNSGGSGGGGGATNTSNAIGAAGTVGQGNAGSNGNQSPFYQGGGGGGAGANASTPNGGIGLQSSITGSSIYYAGGGGGGANGSPGTGGSGGGGNGTTSGTATSGGSNTGGGGGSSNASGTAGSGGSGVVILRIPTVVYSSTTTGSPTVTTDGSDTILTYTGSGTYTT